MVKNRKYSLASTLWISCVLAVAGVALLGERAAAQQQPSKLLFLTHAGLYKHTSLGPAEMAVASWGEEAGYEVTSVQGYLQEQEELRCAERITTLRATRPQFSDGGGERESTPVGAPLPPLAPACPRSRRGPYPAAWIKPCSLS